MIISRVVNAIKRMEAVKQRGQHSPANGASNQSSPGISCAEVADGTFGRRSPVPFLEIAPKKPTRQKPRGYASIRYGAA